MARPAPITAAGTAASTAARASNAATCRSDPPLARSMVSSTSRRATIILAASRITAAPTTIRLTNSSSSTVWIAAWVPRNNDSSEISGEMTVSVSALGASVPVSAGSHRDRAVKRVVQALRLVRGHAAGVKREFPVQLHAGPVERVLHRGELVRVREDAAHPERHGRGRKLLERWGARDRVLRPEGRAGARSRTIAVTKSLTGPVGVATDRRLPGCNPNRAAICVVAATATIPAGTAVPAYAPAMSWALLVSGSR